MERFAIDFRQLGEESDSLIVAFDAQFRYAYVNPQAQRLLAASSDALLGRTIWEVTPALEGTVHAENYRRAMRERTTIEFEAYYPPLDRWDHIRCVPELGGGLIIFARDITEERRTEAARAAAQAFLNQGAAERKRAEDRLRRLFDSQVVGVIFWNLDTSLITDANDTFLSMVGYTREDLAAGLLDFRKMTPSEWTTRNEEGVATIRSEGAAVAYEKEYFRKDGSRVPILIGGTRFEESGAEGFSYILDITERKRREERERGRLQDIFLQAPAFMATLRGPRHIFEMANPPYYQLVAHRDILGKSVGEALPEIVEQGFVDILDRVYQTDEPFIGNDIRLLLQMTPHGPLEERFLDFAYQPLYDENRQVSGILVHGIDQTERKKLEIEQRRLLSEARAHAEREALLNRISEALRLSPDPEAAQVTAVHLLGEALGADRCYIAFYDLSGGIVTILRDWHAPHLPSVEGEYPFTNTVEMFQELYAPNNTSVLSDVHTSGLSDQTLQNMNDLQIRARVSVALADATGVMATLTAVMAQEPREWTEDEVKLVEAVATQLRVGVEAARVQLREHRIAIHLQDALLPAAPRQILGMDIGAYTRAALNEASVGGDFMDVFPLDKELYAVVIGDVSGKGLAAAQQLALIRNSLRTTLYLYRAPAQAATALNAIVTTHDLLVGFVTVWVGVYNAATGQIAYCSCGHEPALVRRANGLMEEMVTTGPPLGVKNNAEYEERSVTLASGDKLLLYTDGLSEAGPNRRELLGTDGLTRLLAALPTDANVQSQAETLVANASHFATGAFRDDVAVLLARRQ